MTFIEHYTPQQVLIAHILHRFSDFKEWSASVQVQVRFLFDQFSRGLINESSFRQMTQEFNPFLRHAADMLITAISYPGRIRYCVKSQRWSHEETTILLAGYFLNRISQVSHILPHRPPRCFKAHVETVVRELEDEGSLREPACTGWVVTRSVGVQCDLIPDIVDLETRLRDSEKGRKATVAKLMRLKKSSWKRFCNLRAKHAIVCRKLLALQEYLMVTDEQQEVPDEEEAGPASLTVQLLRECHEFSSSSRKREYSELLLDLSELILATSPKAYRLIRQLLPLPSISCLNEHFSGSISRLKGWILEQRNVDESVRDIVRWRSGASDDRIISTIGIDAFACRTFTGSSILSSLNEKQMYSNGFVYLETPLDSKKPVQLLHIEPKTNGSYDLTIDSRFNEVVRALRNCGHHVWFKATDGDPYLNREHGPFYKEYLSGRKKYDFNVARDRIHQALLTGVVMPIADPLHFAKNLRGRILDHDVAVTLNFAEDSFPCTTNARQLESILRLGDPLTDTSHIGRMRDGYAVKLFTLDNVHKLLCEGAYPAAVLLFPYACLFTLLYSENLSNQSRVFLVNLAYYSFLRLYKEGKRLIAANIGVHSRFGKSTKAVTIAEPIYCKRILHTCLALGIALMFGPRNIRLDSIGTHLVENTIGLARTISNSPKFDAIIAAFAKAELRKKLALKYNIKLYIPRRINDGGAKVDTLSAEGVTHTESWDAHDISSMLVERAAGLLIVDDDFERFVQDLADFTSCLCMRPFSLPSRSANSGITARNLLYKSGGK